MSARRWALAALALVLACQVRVPVGYGVTVPFPALAGGAEAVVCAVLAVFVLWHVRPALVAASTDGKGKGSLPTGTQTTPVQTCGTCGTSYTGGSHTCRPGRGAR